MKSSEVIWVLVEMLIVSPCIDGFGVVVSRVDRFDRVNRFSCPLAMGIYLLIFRGLDFYFL